MKKKLTAVAVEDLKSKGLEVLENEIKLTLKMGSALVDTTYPMGSMSHFSKGT